MHIDFTGNTVDQPVVRGGFIGCGSHSFRNLFPVFQFVPLDLVATCDLDATKAAAFAHRFGARQSYTDYREMIDREKPDVVFVCTGYREDGRPRYPEIAVDCLDRGVHVWIEKPPAASCKEIERIKTAAQRNNRQVVVGLKKMFFPANEKAYALSRTTAFGSLSHIMIEYPQYIPEKKEFDDWRTGEHNRVVGFLDHLCHPASLLVFLAGMPEKMFYQRNRFGAGTFLFDFPSGVSASISCTFGSAKNGGMERTVLISNTHRHITVENNIRVTFHVDPPSSGYGKNPDFFLGDTAETSSVWEPEFSLGNLHNKGLFLLGYYNEINEMVTSILKGTAPLKGTLDQAWQVTRIFEGALEGPEKSISLC